ncbi:MAG: DUF1788 domain-containing protein [Treponema sp.]|jgi:hypothetical protein|nr:DUF1788 domain-containing protein [Treponema sp.]
MTDTTTTAGTAAAKSRKGLVLQELDVLEGAIKKPEFRKNKGLGNEAGYYIFHYSPEEELLVRERIEKLKNKINKSAAGYSIVEFDLYEIMLDILQKKGFIEKCFKIEKEKGFANLIKELTKMLRVDSDKRDGPVIKHIKENTPPDSVVFITGAGKCYPVIYSHDVLNNLHSVIDAAPVILFYPGEYNGQQLVLFNQIPSKNYYRAFPLN